VGGGDGIGGGGAGEGGGGDGGGGDGGGGDGGGDGAPDAPEPKRSEHTIPPAGVLSVPADAEYHVLPLCTKHPCGQSVPGSYAERQM
jgi:hypothetical protein